MLLTYLNMIKRQLVAKQLMNKPVNVKHQLKPKHMLPLFQAWTNVRLHVNDLGYILGFNRLKENVDHTRSFEMYMTNQLYCI